MKITVKFYCFDLPQDLPETVLELPPGAAIEDAANKCLQLFGLPISAEDFKTSTFIVHHDRKILGDTLHDGDTLQVIRLMEGG